MKKSTILSLHSIFNKSYMSFSQHPSILLYGKSIPSAGNSKWRAHSVLFWRFTSRPWGDICICYYTRYRLTLKLMKEPPIFRDMQTQRIHWIKKWPRIRAETNGENHRNINTCSHTFDGFYELLSPWLELCVGWTFKALSHFFYSLFLF